MPYGQVLVDTVKDSLNNTFAPASSVFTPTALLVKTHNKTGKKYFCKTTRLDLLDKYYGSGVVWKKHIKKHGKDISTGVVGIYYEKDRCVEAALKFSEEWKIIESNEWANVIYENGLDGGGLGEANAMYGKPSPQKGVKRPNVGKSGVDNPMYGKPSAMRGKKNLGASLAHKGRKRPEGAGKKTHAVIGTKDGVEYCFNSVSEAAKFIGSHRASVHKCCTGKQKTGMGYTWKYKEQQ